MNDNDAIDLEATVTPGTDAYAEDLTDSAAAYSTIATGSTLGTATGCASSFGSLSSFG